MGCRELDITSYYRFTELENNPYIRYFTPVKKTTYSRFFHKGLSLWGEDGLLSETNHTTSKSYLAMADGNRNIVGYIDSADGAEVASYEYSPFGKTIVKSGTMADDFNFKFSSYYTDNETDLVYYGYRYYDADMGRWLNRDPIGESGGNNLYTACSNDCVNNTDYLGMISRAFAMKFIDWYFTGKGKTLFIHDTQGEISQSQEFKSYSGAYYLSQIKKFLPKVKKMQVGETKKFTNLDREGSGGLVMGGFWAKATIGGSHGPLGVKGFVKVKITEPCKADFSFLTTWYWFDVADMHAEKGDWFYIGLGYLGVGKEYAFVIEWQHDYKKTQEFRP